VNSQRIEPFESSLSLDLFLLGGLRRELAAWLARIHVAGDVRDEIILATHEAAANAIEHARSGSEVTVRAVRDANKVIVVVTNSGRWAEPRSLDEARGRGLTLIKQLMSDLEIQVKSQRTVVRMRKDLSMAAADA
jgi:serine/threonine-protein kinase RsbW